MAGIVIVAVTIAVAIGIAVAVIAARDRVAGETAGHAADHGTYDTMGCKAANQGAAACAQRGCRAVGMATTLVGRSGDGASAKNDQAGDGNFANMFHRILLGLSRNTIRKRDAETNGSNPGHPRFKAWQELGRFRG